MNSIQQSYRARIATSAAIGARAARVMPGGDNSCPAWPVRRGALARCSS
jgi:hypothetical protein